MKIRRNIHFYNDPGDQVYSRAYSALDWTDFKYIDAFRHAAAQRIGGILATYDFRDRLARM